MYCAKRISMYRNGLVTLLETFTYPCEMRLRCSLAADAMQEVVKVVIVVGDQPVVYFLNSRRWFFHVDFVIRFLLPRSSKTAKMMRDFNKVQYCSEERSFILGIVVHYADLDVYGFELWPGDTLVRGGTQHTSLWLGTSMTATAICTLLYWSEVLSSDALQAAPRIAEAYAIIRDAVFFGSKLRFRPSSTYHQKGMDSLPEDQRPPVLDTQKLYHGVKYQPLTVGECVGYLRVRRNDDEAPAMLSDTDILMIESVPLDIPLLSGLITCELQTPLCHVALLSQSRGMPNMALRDGLSIESVTQLEGQLVRLTVTLQEYSIAPASAEELAAWEKERKEKRAVIEQPTANLDVRTLVSIEEARHNKVKNSVGAKASQYAVLVDRLRKLGSPRYMTLEAFVVPFHFYHEHVQRCCPAALQAVLGAEWSSEAPLRSSTELVDAKSRTPGEGRNIRASGASVLLGSATDSVVDVPSEKSDVVQRLRDEIQYGEVDDSLLDAFIDRVREWRASGVLAEGQGVIVRSSTNVEDLEGFNGAGLYLSEPLHHEHLENRDEIASVIKKVWASLWSMGGYNEREYFSICQDHVSIALLIQPFFDGTRVKANGVAVTRNPFRKDFRAFLVNVQSGSEYRVTDSCSGVTSEQVLIYDDEEPTPEILSYSSLVDTPILSSTDIQDLFIVLDTLDRLWRKRAKRSAKVKPAVDVEFLILNDEPSHILILQARPI